jgi:hypothetical protein
MKDKIDTSLERASRDLHIYATNTELFQNGAKMIFPVIDVRLLNVI